MLQEIWGILHLAWGHVTRHSLHFAPFDCHRSRFYFYPELALNQGLQKTKQHTAIIQRAN